MQRGCWGNYTYGFSKRTFRAERSSWTISTNFTDEAIRFLKEQYSHVNVMLAHCRGVSALRAARHFDTRGAAINHAVETMRETFPRMKAFLQTI